MIEIKQKPLIFTLLSSVLFLFSCTHCNDCIDNLSEVYNKSKYKGNDIVTFINNKNIEIEDTVLLTYKTVPEEYCYSITGKEPYRSVECVGDLSITLGDYKIKYTTSLLSDNKVNCELSFYGTYLGQQFYKSENIDYYHKGILIKVKHFTIIDTSYLEKKEYCIDCFISVNENVLYEYTTYNQGIIENWKLK